VVLLLSVAFACCLISYQTLDLSIVCCKKLQGNASKWHSCLMAEMVFLQQGSADQVIMQLSFLHQQ